MADSLSQCTEALDSAVHLLSSTVSRLESESKASNGLTMSLLQPRRVFELVSEYDVQRAKLDLIEEVEPLIKSLSGKVVKSLTKLERERDTLQQTLELNALRLNNRYSGNESPEADVSSDLVIMTSSTSEELEQLKELKLQKARLSEAIQELERGNELPEL